MEEEIWKPIKGYEGLYEISNLGRVKSLNYKGTGKEKILKNTENGKGYLFVDLYKNGKIKKFRIHRLVLMTFKPIEGMGKLDVNHIDENKQNNSLENLEWCDRKYNCNYGTRNQRSAQSRSIPVVQLNSNTNEVLNIYDGAREAERQGGFKSRKIGACCRGEQKTHKGFKWMFLEDYKNGKPPSETPKKEVPGKSVVQIDINTNEVIKVWQSAGEAKRQGGFNKSAISSCCNNKFNRPGNNIYKGYKWMFLSDYEKLNEEN